MNQLAVSKNLVILVLMLLAPSAYAEQKFQKLHGAQIRAKFSGI